MSSPEQELASEITQLKQFFSSYLTDAATLTSNIRQLVYELIGIDLQKGKNQDVQPEMVAILVACKQCYDDLKKVESMLKGHLKAKKCQRSQSTYSRMSSPVQFHHYEPDLPLSYQRNSTLKPAPQGNLESRTTVRTTLTQDQLKYRTTRDRFGHTLDTLSFKKDDSSRRELTANNRSLQMISKIQALKESRSKQLQSFERGNNECLTIIQKLKNELLGRKSRKLKKQKKK